MGERLKSFLEKNKELIKENKWCDLYDEAVDNGISGELANFLYEGLGVENMLDCFSVEGKIPDFAFFNCGSFPEINIPDDVTSIGEYAFYRCSRLKSITIPDSVTSIGDRAFEYCKCHIIFECDKSALKKNALVGFEGTYEFK